ncbi:hypothetical protein N692_09125 [Lactiplantibacillus plantarum EGD-AQ4]|nr:hypothetical protein N692_09125 [Lactiplantibacillus plantarum EGD-AQ4]
MNATTASWFLIGVKNVRRLQDDCVQFCRDGVVSVD